MDYNTKTLVPIIPYSEYDSVAEEFLELFCPEALRTPMPVPIADIAVNGLGLNLQEVCLSEELDIYGMTIFSDGKVDIYLPDEGIYETRLFKKKTVLIDPEAVAKTNIGCKNNTIAHECVHWYKHRMYYKMQKYSIARQAIYCKCRESQIQTATDDEAIMESQAVGIAPRILMPKATFTEAAQKLNIEYGRDNWKEICLLADFFDVSKQSVSIRLEECGII